VSKSEAALALLAEEGSTDVNSKPLHHGLIGQLADAQNDLRPSERKVCAVILGDPVGVSRATLSEVAMWSGVSEPSVLRFARTLGFNGFQDFKYALIQYLASGIPAAHEAVVRDDSAAEIASKIFDHSMESLRKTKELLNMADLERAVSALRGAREVLVLGFGASGIVGQDAAQKFPLFGIPINAPVDAHQQFIAASLSSQSTVVLAISNTASTYEVLNSAREAKSRSATVISISGQQGPLTDISDIVLRHAPDDTDTYTPSTSRVAALVIVDILAIAVAVHQSSDHLAALYQSKVRLSAMRQGSLLGPTDDIVIDLETVR
jgi:RpiR family carbohydrate utilization transcriptional regulator